MAIRFATTNQKKKKKKRRKEKKICQLGTIIDELKSYRVVSTILDFIRSKMVRPNMNDHIAATEHITHSLIYHMY